MKKVMLFAVAFLFSLSVQAASLTLEKDDTFGNADQYVSIAYGKTVLAQGTVYSAGEWDSSFLLKSDVDTYAKVTWTFNDAVDMSKATLTFGEVFGIPEVNKLVNGNFSFTVKLFQGVDYWVNVVGAKALGPMNYAVSVKAVPVPAAAFLFTPALLGLFGLRRKGQLKAA